MVAFVYEPFPRYDVMLLVGAATIAALGYAPRMLRRRRETVGAVADGLEGSEPPPESEAG
ncbi:MAG: hypothetical protein A2Z48_02385 [Actinobacteria bacterium RBG_19FT_COMBO_70_19]|nr:MAG: hypothetical protein A2Z48_02385 [Actinobacteria bacterium RBG_19FT_COMBO_70_19]